jgi:transcriptional regulator
MYLPKSFAETRTEPLQALVRAQPFGTLVVMTDGGLSVVHLPFLIADSAGPLGTLRGHVARANPLVEAAVAEVDAVAIFQGPDHYISPSWYATKKETGKVVPTWNYVVAHAYGRLRFVDDPRWLRSHLEQLTGRHEAGRAHAWKVSDAPEDYLEKLIGTIVGLEIPIGRLLGKWKLGQNRPEADRLGMIDGLRREDDGSAAALAALIEDTDRLGT